MAKSREVAANTGRIPVAFAAELAELGREKNRQPEAKDE